MRILRGSVRLRSSPPVALKRISTMTNRLRLVLVLHQHQPVGNLDSENENVFRETYQPLIDTLADYPTLPVNLHVSGSLIDWLAARHPEYLHRLRDLAMAGRVEMMGGAYHDPILPMLPEVDRRGQIDSFSRRLGGLFGQRPRGFWLPERIWDPALAADLAACDIEHTVLDDYHFHATGLTNEQLRGYYLTEAAGQLIAAFAGDEHLRYLVPFAEPEEAIAYLRGIAQTTPGSVMVYADDAEKFGSWPGMHQRIYGERWLRRFFDALVANSSWLQVTTLGECIDHVPPLGKIYIPEGGYREMAIWSTVAEDPRFAVRQSISPTLADAGEAVDAQSVLFAENARNHGRLAAGTWRNFRVKYPEINEMYCRMLAVSRRCAAAEDDPQQVELARQALYRAQCGCAYWHGMFGGVYLPHLRQSVYQNLIEAESLLNLAAGRTGPWLSVTIDDLNLDVHKELLLANDHLSVRLAPEFGGQIYELDVFDKPINLLATLSRKQEPYHPAVNATGSGAGEPPRLIYDAYPRKSLLDHFFDPMTSLDDVARGVSDKMIRRHPHVFGAETRDKTPQQQTAEWERLKAQERAGKSQVRVLDGVALGLPALTRAVKLQKRAARVGFDWPSTHEVLAKIVEETQELVDARETLSQAEITEEFGDLLFVMANLARHLNVDPEAALRAANSKFIRRFGRIEDWLSDAGRTPSDSDLAEMDSLWERAKAEERASSER